MTLIELCSRSIPVQNPRRIPRFVHWGIRTKSSHLLQGQPNYGRLYMDITILECFSDMRCTGVDIQLFLNQESDEKL